MDTDIYKTPNAQLRRGPPTLDDLPGLSTWWVLLLSIVTLSLYALYWMFDRSRIINQMLPDNRIPDFFIYGVPLVWVPTQVIDLAAQFVTVDFYPETMRAIVGLASNIMLIVWAFSMRSRLQFLFDAESGHRDISAIVTFFFSPYYLAYKINEAKSNAPQAPVSEEPPEPPEELHKFDA